MSIVKNTSGELPETGMNNMLLPDLPKIDNVAFVKDVIAFVLSDGRIIYIPIAWSKKLQKANFKKRSNFKNTGIHVFWDELDEIIGVKNILFGKELFM